MRRRILMLVVAALLIGVMAGIFVMTHDRPVRGIFPQDAYIWQRVWTPGVGDTANGASGFRRLVVLYAEISLRSEPGSVVKIPLPATLPARDLGMAIRIGSVSSEAAFVADSWQTKLVVQTAAEACGTGAKISELQIDFDCPESKLGGYISWVRAIQQAVGPVPVVVTVLPSWVKDAGFGELVRQSGEFVLQVHSLHRPEGPGGAMVLCDPEEARQAVAEAARYSVPFRVALPTYTYFAGFSPEGKFLGMSAEGPAPNWPAGAIIRPLRADPEAMAQLIVDWTEKRPKFMKGVIWYRLPMPDDQMNWKMPTLAAVMVGKTPQAGISALAVHSDKGRYDLFLQNTGDADGPFNWRIGIDAGEAQIVADDAMEGFKTLDQTANRVTFEGTDRLRWIAPGQKIPVGWIRLSADKEVHVTLQTPK